MRTETNVSFSGLQDKDYQSKAGGIDSIFGDPSKSAHELDEDDPPFSCPEAETPGLLFHQ
jgi:hypothetical protein